MHAVQSSPPNPLPRLALWETTRLQLDIYEELKPAAFHFWNPTDYQQGNVMSDANSPKQAL